MKIPIASSRHLSAFALDVQYDLDQMDLFSRIKVKKTSLPECALSIVCTVADASTTQAQVAQMLEQVWKEASLGYGEGEDTCQVTTRNGEVQMGFSTATEDARVTGRIEVIGFR